MPSPLPTSRCGRRVISSTATSTTPASGAGHFTLIDLLTPRIKGESEGGGEWTIKVVEDKGEPETQVPEAFKVA